MYYDASGSEMFEEKWDEATKDMKVKLDSQYIIVGQQGAALNVQENPFTSEWYNVPESGPHITLLVNKGFQSKDLGPMMLAATHVWEKNREPRYLNSAERGHVKNFV